MICVLRGGGGGAEGCPCRVSATSKSSPLESACPSTPWLHARRPPPPPPPPPSTPPSSRSANCASSSSASSGTPTRMAARAGSMPNSSGSAGRASSGAAPRRASRVAAADAVMPLAARSLATSARDLVTAPLRSAPSPCTSQSGRSASSPASAAPEAAKAGVSPEPAAAAAAAATEPAVHSLLASLSRWSSSHCRAPQMMLIVLPVPGCNGRCA
eukprot:362070-Chlamydomonas_euryale.AAC.8